jgi:pSer/pThr/pTyr-binding forkhead associated (FHA) protein
MVEPQPTRSARESCPYLTEKTGLLGIKIIPLPIGTTLFGRKPSNDVVLDSAAIGSHKAKFIRNDDETWIEDVGARNGIYVDGELVPDRKRLQDGSEIRLSNYVFRYHDGTTENE